MILYYKYDYRDSIAKIRVQQEEGKGTSGGYVFVTFPFPSF
jgi:hypothetical protein